jgi:hypothetical protein
VVEPPPAEPSGTAKPSPAVEPPTLPDRSADENDEAWGDSEGTGGRDRAWYERERPPHHE